MIKIVPLYPQQKNFSVCIQPWKNKETAHWHHIERLHPSSSENLWSREGWNSQTNWWVQLKIRNSLHSKWRKTVYFFKKKAFREVSTNACSKTNERWCHLSYKKCKSRPTSVDLSKVKAFRILFAAYFVDILNNDTLIVNVDEATISRSLKINYSWSIKGKSTEFKNAPGSVKVIMAILSNGLWFVMLTSNTIDSDVFIEFLGQINQWIRRNVLFGYLKIMMTLDNCPCHQSNKSKKFMAKLGYNILFLPPYSLQLSPIEGVFGVLKHRLKTKYKFSALNLSSTINRDKIFNALKTFDSSQIRAYFKNFYKWIRTVLESPVSDHNH